MATLEKRIFKLMRARCERCCYLGFCDLDVVMIAEVDGNVIFISVENPVEPKSPLCHYQISASAQSSHIAQDSTSRRQSFLARIYRR
jgi:hypothetical protein